MSSTCRNQCKGMCVTSLLIVQEQPFIKDNSRTVGEVIKSTIAAIGENIQVCGPDVHRLVSGCHLVACLVTPLRDCKGAPSVPQVRQFARYVLGEGLEKKSNDFAAEVAQQTGRA
jgi:translation elongation factor EF-Ts